MNFPALYMLAVIMQVLCEQKECLLTILHLYYHPFASFLIVIVMVIVICSSTDDTSLHFP